MDHSILDSEIFPSHYTVFRKDRKINGRRGGGVLIAVRDYITVSFRPTHPWDSEMFFIDVLLSQLEPTDNYWRVLSTPGK